MRRAGGRVSREASGARWERWAPGRPSPLRPPCLALGIRRGGHERPLPLRCLVWPSSWVLAGPGPLRGWGWAPVSKPPAHPATPTGVKRWGIPVDRWLWALTEPCHPPRRLVSPSDGATLLESCAVSAGLAETWDHCVPPCCFPWLHLPAERLPCHTEGESLVLWVCRGRGHREWRGPSGAPAWPSRAPSPGRASQA